MTGASIDGADMINANMLKANILIESPFAVHGTTLSEGGNGQKHR
jgi:hypothetical protein